MGRIGFTANTTPTLGVELELALVDAETMALTSAAQQLLAGLPERLRGSVKPELMQCYLEINTGVCRTPDEAFADLAAKLADAERVASGLGARLLWTSTHPFSLWQDQIPTPSERYLQLLDKLQDMGRQLITFGLHVHVGVDSGDKAIMICDRILRRLPTLLAASCNSPWWNGRRTGLLSHRSKIMEGLPTSGLPPLMRNWSEYVWLVSHLEDTGFIGSIRDIWWTVRPHHNFGTVEVRVCDMPGTLEDAIAIAALTQALVVGLSDQIDDGAYQHDCHPMLVRQNMWRATRFGLDASLIDTMTFEDKPARQTLIDLVRNLEPTAKALGSSDWLDRAGALAEGPTWAERQLAWYEETGEPAEVVRRMLAATERAAGSAA